MNKYIKYIIYVFTTIVFCMSIISIYSLDRIVTSSDDGMSALSDVQYIIFISSKLVFYTILVIGLYKVIVTEKPTQVSSNNQNTYNERSN